MNRLIFVRRFLVVLMMLAGILSSPAVAAERDADDKALRDVAERFFTAYASKDVDAFMALWSDKSPDYEARKKIMAGLYAETGPIELKSLVVVRVRRNGDAASVRVRVELAANDIKTGKPHPSFGALDRVLDLAREGDGWKIVRYGPSDRRLMERLVAAKTKAERLRLLDDDSDLIGYDFVLTVLQEGNSRSGRGKFDEAATLLDVAQEVAEGLGNADTLGLCYFYRGYSLEQQSRHEPALASYQKALALFRRANDRMGERNALHNIGVVYSATGRYTEALWQFQESLKITRELKDRAGEALNLNSIGAVYQKTGRQEEALRQYQDSLKIAREVGDRASEAATLNNIGNVYRETGRYTEALQQYQDSLKIARDLKDHGLEAKALNNIGIAYEETGRYTEALQQYQDSLKIKRDLKDRAGEAATLNAIGNVYLDTGHYGEALQQYQDSLKIAREVGDRAGEAKALYNTGAVYDVTSRYGEALRQYQDSLKIAREVGDRKGEAATLNNIGTVYSDMGRYPEALQQHQDSLKIARDLGDRKGEAGSLNNIGNVYRATGRYTEALQQFRDSLQITRRLGGRDLEAKALSNIGAVYSETGRYQEALRQYQDSLKIAHEIGNRAGEAAALNNIGAAYARTGRYGEALQQYQDSLKIKRELGDRAGQANTLIGIADVYMETGLYPEALQQYQGGLKITRDLGGRVTEAKILNGIGNIYLEMGRHAESLEQYQDSLKIKRELGDRAGEATTLHNIGGAYARTGRYGEALQQYQDSLKIKHELGDQAGEALTLNNIGAVYQKTGRQEEALRQYQDSLKIAREVGDRKGEARTLGNIGLVYRGQKAWTKAVQTFGEAVSDVEQVRADAREPSLQTSFLNGNTGAYFSLSECLLELHKPAEAFAAGERMKARGLVDILREGKADLHRGMSHDERKEEQKLQDGLTALGVELENLRSKKADLDRQTGLARDLDKARQEYEAFRRDLFLHRPDVATRRAEFAPASPGDLGAALFTGRRGLVVLSYLVGEKETLLFVLTAPEKEGGAARLTVHRLDVEWKNLAEAVGSFRDACSDAEKGEPDSEELYRWLLAPAADELAGAKQVVIVPDSELHTLPFQALKNPDGKYLIERFAVSYAPSVTALAKMEELGARRRKEYAGRPASLLAVGVSDFGRRERPLPAAEKEARAVAAAFGDGAKLLPGAEATLAKLEASWSGRRYLHFATHGRLNPDAPLYSSLVLSPGRDGDEGVLYARDLVDAEIPAELVVMSACHTGEGRHVNGEGLLGMSWSWFAAGVPSTVASQWRVGDTSTARLMKAFYARLTAGDSKAEALRQAELTLLKDSSTRHPFYWAPFVLVGDDR